MKDTYAAYEVELGGGTDITGSGNSLRKVFEVLDMDILELEKLVGLKVESEPKQFKEVEVASEMESIILGAIGECVKAQIRVRRIVEILRSVRTLVGVGNANSK